MADAFPNAQSPAPNATETIDARKFLVPGWYWADLRSQDVAAYQKFLNDNPTVKGAKTATKGEMTWVLFQVGGTSPVVYTPAGLAYQALKGASTEVQDVFPDTSIDQVSDPARDFEAFWKKFMDQLGTAGQVVLWGGVAIVLYKLWQAGGSPSASRSSSRDDDYEEREEHHVTVRAPRSGRRRTSTGTLISRS